MEEDLKILDGLVKGIYKYGFDYDVDGEKHDILRYEEFNALENLIKGYRELEEKYNNLKIRHNGTKEALRVSEELERHFSEEASKLEAELDDSIPKSKIKEKIEEIKEKDKAYKTYTKDGRENFITEYFAIKVLQELIEDK